MPPKRSTCAQRLLVATLAFVIPRPSACQELHVDPSAPTVVRFVSHTQVDEFEGVTEKIDGYALLDGQPLSTSTRADRTELYFEVDLASIDTGIGLRNRHMRDNYLEVQKYPYATFKGRLAHVDAEEHGGVHVTAVGTFSVHGVSAEREIPCEVTSNGDAYRTQCSFPVLLSDHHIDIPRVMFLKLANEIELHVEFTLSPAGDHPGENP
jgi:polyisoprenoid-binding protein YceI